MSNTPGPRLLFGIPKPAVRHSSFFFARTLPPSATLPVTCTTAARRTQEPKWKPWARRERLRSAVCLGRLSRWSGDSVSRHRHRRRTGTMQGSPQQGLSQLAAVASQVIGQSWWVPQRVTAGSLPCCLELGRLLLSTPGISIIADNSLAQ